MRFCIGILYLIVFFSSSSYAVLKDAYYSAERYYGSDGLSFESLVADIQSKNKESITVSRLDDVLSLLPEEFLKGYALVYRSRSLQEASAEYPRAIVFGHSAEFILAFNGHAKQRGYNQLEMIQYRAKERRWEFREMTFTEGQSPQVSGPNPKKCLECHQSPKRLDVDPRPNWEPYSFWPGVYASMDGKIHSLLPEYYDNMKKNKAFEQSLMGLPFEEIQHRQENYKTKYLGVLAQFLEQDFVLVEEQANEESGVVYFERVIKEQPNSRYRHLGPFSVHGPTNLTRNLVTLNMRRVARLIQQALPGELMNDFVYALAGLRPSGGLYNDPETSELRYMNACDRIYLPDHLLKLFISETLARKPIASDKYTPVEGKYFQLDLGAALDILLMPTGVLTEDWSMDFKTNGRFSFGSSGRFASPNDAKSDYISSFYEAMSSSSEIQFMSCEELQSKSEERFLQLEKSGRLEALLSRSEELWQQRRKRPLMDRCVACHVNFEDGLDAPMIPFDNPIRLSKELSKAGYKRGTLLDEIRYRLSDHVPSHLQMPPAGVRSVEERARFIKEMTQLMNENK